MKIDERITNREEKKIKFLRKASRKHVGLRRTQVRVGCLALGEEERRGWVSVNKQRTGSTDQRVVPAAHQANDVRRCHMSRCPVFRIPSSSCSDRVAFG